MNSLCIKTNNEELLSYLQNEFKNFNMLNVFYSCNEFKHYKNIIIHYKGIDTELFYTKLATIFSYLVIEHFENLQEVLEKVSSIVKKGGVFCFSTPNYRGISGRKSSETFFKNSPSDHFTVWNKRAAKIILEKYGFKPVRFRFTGIHPERFPGKGYLRPGGKDLRGLKRFEYSTLFSLMKLLRLGDTFEVYGVKK